MGWAEVKVGSCVTCVNLCGFRSVGSTMNGFEIHLSPPSLSDARFRCLGATTLTFGDVHEDDEGNPIIGE